MSTDELVEKSVTELAELIRTKAVSPVEATTALLDHAQALNPEINAYISFREQALADAGRAQEEIARGGYRGVWHGIPLAVKDNLYVGGEVTTMASKIHRDFIPTDDATVIRRLRQAGAVLTGKLNMHEYAWGIDNNSPHFGPVRNPWDTAKIPGGSSGGSAAAVAAHMTYASLGTDTAGSIRIPSAACGIVGLKPTHGRVPKDGCFPLSWTLDHIGPMTKTVADAAAMLQVIAGFDPRDPTCIDTPVPDYSSTLTGDVSGLVIGIEEDYFFRDVDAGIERLVRDQITALADRGARVQPVTIPALAHAEWAELATSLTEAAAIHHRDLAGRPDDFGDDIRLLFELGELFSAVEYHQAQQVRRQLKNEFLAALGAADVLITPTLPVMAPDVGCTEADLGGRKVDLIDNFIRFTGPSNLTGLPAMSVPIGLHGGLPVGLQIVGSAFNERTVLNVGRAVEAGTPMAGCTPPVLR